VVTTNLALSSGAAWPEDLSELCAAYQLARALHQTREKCGGQRDAQEGKPCAVRSPEGRSHVNQLRHLIPHRPVPPAAARGSFEKGAVSTAVRPLHRHQLAAGAPGSPGPALDVHGVPAPVHDRRRSTAGACLDPGWRGRQNQLRRVLARVTTPAVQNSHVFCSNYLDRELHQARRWLSSRSLARFRCAFITTRSFCFVEGPLVQRCGSRVPLTLW
jgi:hypothetical protein